jgi:7-cyano-7-deazaguanine synthase
MSRAVVCLFSGGPDSYIAALTAKNDGHQLYLLTADYGQKTRLKEVAAARVLSRTLKPVDHLVVSLPFVAHFGGSGLTDPDSRIGMENASTEYVPFRNSLLLCIAVAWAEALGAHAVVTGSTGAPWNTPDNSSEYYAAFQRLVNIGTRVGAALEIRAPFCTWSKKQVIELGLSLGVPFEHTWSCHNNTDVACGDCSNCRDRLSAFVSLGVADPISYARRVL